MHLLHNSVDIDKDLWVSDFFSFLFSFFHCFLHAIFVFLKSHFIITWLHSVVLDRWKWIETWDTRALQVPRSRTTSREGEKLRKSSEYSMKMGRKDFSFYVIQFALLSTASDTLTTPFGQKVSLHWSTKVRTMTGKIGCKNTQLKQSKIKFSLTTSNALIVGFSNHIKLIHISPFKWDAPCTACQMHRFSARRVGNRQNFNSISFWF